MDRQPGQASQHGRFRFRSAAVDFQQGLLAFALQPAAKRASLEQPGQFRIDRDIFRQQGSLAAGDANDERLLDTGQFGFGSTATERTLSVASAAAVSLGVSSTGAARLTTTPLITPEEMDHAAGKKVAYKAPGV